jgi:hypothetical protein
MATLRENNQDETWKTVRRAMEKELKLPSGVPNSKLKAPPNNCIPRRAKMRMNRKRRNSREMMDRIELSSDITRFLSDDQYLDDGENSNNIGFNHRL